ncbi:MAG: hypothetical protein IT373_30260 [Polyangiaceae bacterium]|nr:hypothetical protein [Polyangiaceae bacterium]
MADHGRTYRAMRVRTALSIGLGSTALALTGCGVEDMQAGFLETACGMQYDYYASQPQPGCTLAGDVQQVSGLTASDVGFHFGPGGGSIFFRLTGILNSQSTPWSLEALAAASGDAPGQMKRAIAWGTCGIYCPAAVPEASYDVDAEAKWQYLAEDLPGYGSETPPSDGVLRLTATDVDLYELRVPSLVD